MTRAYWQHVSGALPLGLSFQPGRQVSSLTPFQDQADSVGLVFEPLHQLDHIGMCLRLPHSLQARNLFDAHGPRHLSVSLHDIQSSVVEIADDHCGAMVGGLQDSFAAILVLRIGEGRGAEH